MGNLKSKEKGNPHVKKIVDRVWERFASTSEHRALGVQDLYCAILLVYNDINKTLPGPFNDPPTKEEVQELLKTYDRNNDGMLDRNEFTAFIETFTKNVSARAVSSGKCDYRWCGFHSVHRDLDLLYCFIYTRININWTQSLILKRKEDYFYSAHGRLLNHTLNTFNVPFTVISNLHQII